MKRTWQTMLVLLTLTACSDDGGDAGSELGDEANDAAASEDSTSDDTSGDTTTSDTSGDTTSGDTTSDTTSEGPSETTGEPLSFAADIYPIFMTECGCHVGNAPGQLAMPNADTAYTNLVGVASVQVDKDRVAPGDPVGSYLQDKITNSQAFGDPMPPLGPLLGGADVATIESWIAGGALP